MLTPCFSSLEVLLFFPRSASLSPRVASCRKTMPMALFFAKLSWLLTRDMDAGVLPPRPRFLNDPITFRYSTHTTQSVRSGFQSSVTLHPRLNDLLRDDPRRSTTLTDATLIAETGAAISCHRCDKKSNHVVCLWLLLYCPGDFTKISSTPFNLVSWLAFPPVTYYALVI
ncbi:hypothetical protein GGR57DRAFT_232569 [Xylariaceae sp. FL1272]|nr:hypothetical protein GGR57DRAFT_232569 [Xylariaceae sp. FL1272]